MIFYVYILQSEKDGSFYIGQSSNLNDRLIRHNSGTEKYTSKKMPWKLFWSIELPSRSEAMALERKLKNLKSRQRIVEFVNRNVAGPVA